MPFWLRVILTIIFTSPIMFASGFIINAISSSLFRLIPLGSSRYKTQYIPPAITSLITLIVGFIFLYYKNHVLASSMFLIFSAHLAALIPFFGNFLVPFLESYRNLQFIIWIVACLYFTYTLLYHYPLLAIIIGIICVLTLVLYLGFLKRLQRRFIKMLTKREEK